MSPTMTGPRTAAAARKVCGEQPEDRIELGRERELGDHDRSLTSGIDAKIFATASLREGLERTPGV